MSVPSLACEVPPVNRQGGRECRIYERHACELPTTCQPIAARLDGDIVWPALIRDVSEGGLGVVLGRRFERGAGLAIELPEANGRQAETLLAKVVHTTSLPGNKWLLGCAFVSRLSDDQVRLVVELAESLQPPREAVGTIPSSEETPTLPPVRTPKPSPVVITDLWFEGITPEGRSVRLPVRRLFLTGAWPLAAGTVLRLWVGTKTNHPTGTRVQVVACQREGEYWTVRYRPLEPLSARALASLGFAG